MFTLFFLLLLHTTTACTDETAVEILKQISNEPKCSNFEMNNLDDALNDGNFGNFKQLCQDGCMPTIIDVMNDLLDEGCLEEMEEDLNATPEQLKMVFNDMGPKLCSYNTNEDLCVNEIESLFRTIFTEGDEVTDEQCQAIDDFGCCFDTIQYVFENDGIQQLIPDLGNISLGLDFIEFQCNKPDQDMCPTWWNGLDGSESSESSFATKIEPLYATLFGLLLF